MSTIPELAHLHTATGLPASPSPPISSTVQTHPPQPLPSSIPSPPPIPTQTPRLTTPHPLTPSQTWSASLHTTLHNTASLALRTPTPLSTTQRRHTAFLTSQANRERESIEYHRLEALWDLEGRPVYGGGETASVRGAVPVWKRWLRPGFRGGGMPWGHQEQVAVATRGERAVRSVSGGMVAGSRMNSLVSDFPLDGDILMSTPGLSVDSRGSVEVLDAMPIVRGTAQQITIAPSGVRSRGEVLEGVRRSMEVIEGVSVLRRNSSEATVRGSERDLGEEEEVLEEEKCRFWRVVGRVLWCWSGREERRDVGKG